MTDDLAFLDIAEAARLIRSRALSPVELTQACLARILAHDHALGSFIRLDEAAALAAARRAEDAIMRGDDAGPLAGIPIALKDVFDTADMPTTGNSRLFRERRPDRDAFAVERLRAAGAVILGKLAAWECAVGGTSFDLPWPPARNPWDLARDPGGSSSGSGAALAAGFCLGATGSDTGGSIREPAAWCGVAGLKPTYGLVSTAGVMAASHSLDHVGPMARTALGCALLLDAMAAPDAGDPATIARPPGSFADGIGRGVAGLRIGVVALDGEPAEIEAEIAATLADAAKAFASLGAALSSVRLPSLMLYSAVCTVLAAADGFHLHRAALAGAAMLYDPLTRQRLAVGERVAAADYVAAQCVRRRLAVETAHAMAGVDLLLMPVSAGTAPLLGQFDSHAGHVSLTRPWNVTGYPALALPSGSGRDGLPLAVQIIGRPLADGLALRAGHALERERDDGARRPPLRTADDSAPVRPGFDEAASMAALVASTERAAALVRDAAAGFSPACVFRAG